MRGQEIRDVIFINNFSWNWRIFVKTEEIYDPQTFGQTGTDFVKVEEPQWLTKISRMQGVQAICLRSF